MTDRHIETEQPYDTIASARERGSILLIGVSCSGESCPWTTKEARLKIEDHDNQLLPLLQSRTHLQCPLCGTTISVRWACTEDEAREYEHWMAQLAREEARKSWADEDLVSFLWDEPTPESHEPSGEQGQP